MDRPRWLMLLAAALCACGSREPPPPAPGIDVDRKVLTIGMLNDESGPVAVIGRPWAVGKRVLLRQVNEGRSGLLPEGWTLEYLERDHGYDVQRARARFEELRARVLFLGTSFGTVHTLQLRPQLERDRIVAFAASLSSKLQESEFTPLLAPSYRVEAMRALDWAVEQAGGAAQVRLGLIYQQDDYGHDARQAALAAAERAGVAVVAELGYATGQPDYTAEVATLKRARATHVLMSTVPNATGPILGIAAQLGYRPVWIGNSPSWLDRFFDPTVVPPAFFANYYWVVSSAYWGENVPFMRGFLAAYEKYGRELMPPDFYILAAYIQGLTQLEIARRMITAGELSREGYFRALRGLKDYDTRGALAESPDFTQWPYAAGTQSRVLKPDFGSRSWRVAGRYARPSALQHDGTVRPE